MTGHVKTAEILHGSGSDWKKRAPAPCAGCGVTFMLYPWQDLPCPNPCTGKKNTKVR